MQEKFIFKSMESARDQLGDLLLNGHDDIPTFFGGPANHEQWYPIESRCPNRGKGTLKFDFYGMVDRLKQHVEDYEQRKRNGFSTLPAVV